MNTIYTTINGYAFKKSDFLDKGKTPIIKIANITIDGIDFNNCKYSNDEGLSQYEALYGDIIIALSGATTGKMSIYNLDTRAYINQRTMILRPNNSLFNPYLLFSFVNSKTKEILQNAYGGAQPNISSQEIENMLIPFPTIKQQDKIYDKLINANNSILDLKKLLNSNNLLKKVIKNKILDTVFIHSSSYKSYYENDFNLGDILEYEQPAPYIVKNTDYNDNFDTPVLTPGKTFVLGFTDEKDGIYKANKENKVIIFDDFTTASRLIDFDFKVKSSAMKILHISDKTKFDIDYMYYLLQTINIIVDTHKRFWISEYAPLKVKIHTFDEQVKIKKRIKSMFEIIDKL